MKRFLIAASALLAVLAVQSCNKDDAPGDSSVVGTWLMRADDYHFFDATFNSDGSYVWDWKGVSGLRRDAGSYTYADDVITMTPENFWESDYENPEELKSVSANDFGWNGPRTVTVVSYEKGIAYWRWKGDWMVQDSDYFRENEGDPIIIFRKGYDYKIKKSDLIGTWSDGAKDGETRILLENSGAYTMSWAWPSEEDGLSVSKDTGTWDLAGNVLTLTAISHSSSFKSLGYNKETQKNEYIYYKVDPETLEAEQWESYNYTEPIVTEYYLVYSDGKIVTNFGEFTKKK